MSVDDNSPPIVLIHCHDLGRYLGCYGAPVETPHVDALAEGGARFENHFVTAPQCSPSRASLLTGRFPHVNGLVGLAHDGWELNDGERVLPQYLGDAGYETHLFGLQHVTEYPERLGYDRIHADDPLTPDALPSVHEAARARSIADEVADWLSGGIDTDVPVFAAVGFFELHRVEDDDYGFEGERYDAPDPADVETLPFLPDEPGVRRDVADMHGMIEAIDDGVGTIVDAIDVAGIADETLLVFTTEHGLAFPRAKGSCYDPGIEAALTMRYPGTITPGTYDELLSNVDVFATLLDFAGVSIPSDVAGRSFRPLVATDGDRVATKAVDDDSGSEEGYEPRERIFAEMTWHDRYNPIRAIRTKRYKYIRNFWHLPRVHVTSDVFASDAGRAVREELLVEDRPYEELYDLETDPSERKNLVNSDSCSDVRTRLHEELVGWMRETDDPLLDGPMVPSDWEEIQPRTG